MIRVLDIADIRLGHPFRGAVEADAMGNEVVVQSKDIGAEARSEPAPLSKIVLPKADERVRLAEGDVVMQSRGSRFPAATVWPEAIGAILAAPLYLIRPKTGRVDPDFLAEMLNAAPAQDALRAAATGSYIPQVPGDAIRQITIPLPPLKAQQAIAALAALGRQEARLNAAIAAQRSVWLHTLALERDGDGVSRNSRRHANAPG